MPATIQQILKPTRARGLDTSGNNNHAQIYSGRALEFDGVTDYLSVDGGTDVTFVDWSEQTTQANKAWTIAFWVKLNTNLSTYQRITGHTSSIVGYIAISGQEKVSVYSLDDGAWQTWDTALNIKSWYRVVVVFDGNTKLTAYLNGKSLGDKTITEPTGDNGDLKLDRIGDDNGNYHLNGCLSDFQAWQGAWTADDAEYDYFNPEQLALNRGGTQLTNSNLKLWYPMNEGHRGNQSYVLDASNTGLGDELINNTDFESNIDNWAVAYTGGSGSGATPSRNTTSPISGTADLKLVNSAGENAGVASNAISFVSGYTYKVSIDAITPDGNLQVKIGNSQQPDAGAIGGSTNQTISTTSTSTNLTYYFTSTETETNYIIFYVSTGRTFYIDNVSIKTVNAKNNATTVFFGDDLFDSGVGDYGDSTGAWAVEGNNTIANDTSALKITFVDDDDGAKLFLKDAADLTSDLTVGRNYRLTFTYKINQVSGANVSLQINKGDATFATTGTLNQTSFTTLTKDFTAMHATNANVRFNNLSSGDILHVKDFTLKEVGIATGWTDADQQLDIPQTALQSYNQLGYNDIYNAGNAPLTTSTSYAPNFGTGDFTIAWSMFSDDLSQNIRFMAVRQTGSSGRIVFQIAGSVNNELKFYMNDDASNAIGYRAISANNVLEEGKWYHIVVSVNRSADTVKCYINGEYQSISEDISSITGNINGGAGIEPYSFSGDTDCFVGVLDNIAIFKGIAFSEDNVLELYNNGTIIEPTQHTSSSYLLNYWRNEGLSLWKDRAGSADMATNRMTETMLITAGVDSSRDSQGFLMNRQRTTNSINGLPNSKGDDTSVYDSGVVVQDSSTLDITGAFTIGCWFKMKDFDNSYNLIQKKNLWNGPGYGIYIHSSFKKPFFEWAPSSGYKQFGGSNNDVDTLDVWYFLYAVHDPDGLHNSSTGIDSMYIAKTTDTSLTTRTSTSMSGGASIDDPVATNDLPLVIGQFTGGGHNPAAVVHFNGEIDDVVVYNGALSPEQVLRNFKAGKRSHK